MCISLANTAVQWTNKVISIWVCSSASLYFFSNSGHTEVSDNIRKFYGQYNNIRSVPGYGSREMCTVHLCKVFCLSTLMYGCESWRVQHRPKQQNRISVAWNNSFRSIFNCCWREPFTVFLSSSANKVHVFDSSTKTFVLEQTIYFG